MLTKLTTDQLKPRWTQKSIDRMIREKLQRYFPIGRDRYGFCENVRGLTPITGHLGKFATSITPLIPKATRKAAARCPILGISWSNLTF